MSEKKLNLDDLKAGDVILFPPHKSDRIAQSIAFLYFRSGKPQRIS
jgi:hypothetical protein